MFHIGKLGLTDPIYLFILLLLITASIAHLSVGYSSVRHTQSQSKNNSRRVAPDGLLDTYSLSLPVEGNAKEMLKLL